MVSRPVDSSIRSKQTGQVGSSIRAGVGGATGLELRDTDEREDCSTVPVVLDVSIRGGEGVNGSLVISGKVGSGLVAGGVRSSTDLINTTWQFSVFKVSSSAPSKFRQLSGLYHTSKSSNGFPFHSFLHSLAFLPLLNFMSTIYRLPLSVLIMRK